VTLVVLCVDGRNSIVLSYWKLRTAITKLQVCLSIFALLLLGYGWTLRRKWTSNGCTLTKLPAMYQTVCICCYMLFRYQLVLIALLNDIPIRKFKFRKPTSPCDILRHIHDVHNQQNSTNLPDDVQVNENHTTNECGSAL